MTPPLWQKWRGTEESLDESERGEWKSWLKAQHSKNEDHDIWSHHFMANAAKSLQSCPTLCDPIDGSPPGSPVTGILQARTLEWAAISFSNAWKWKLKVKSLSRARLLATPWTAAYQAPPSMGFSRQHYWSGLPLPSPSWQIDGEIMETVTDFLFLGSKITADGDCSHEVKRRLLLGRKAMTNLDSILKSRDITSLTKVHLVKAVVFPGVMYGCESWTIKKS